jgi:methionine-rich copper-binding protein CopC
MRPVVTTVSALILLGAFSLAPAHAQNKKKNPTSKVFVADVSGEAQIDIGESIQDLAKKSVYDAQGTIIETKKAEKEEDKTKIFSTVVFSNGTGAYFDHDTRIEVKKFIQEPFTPNRTDMDTEPSISQTQAFLARGSVGLCNSKQVAGSTMNYATPHGSVAVRGKKVVISVDDSETKISMIEGDSTVRAGDLDMGGQSLRVGEQAIIRRGPVGQPNQIIIQKIPPAELSGMDDKVAQACIAKKSVYFEVKEKKNDGTPGDSTGGDSSLITAFDGNSANNTSSVGGGEIVVIPTLPKDLPVSFTVSPAVIPGPGSE